MNVLTRIYYTLTPYVDRSEKRVGMFFAKLREHGNIKPVRNHLLELLQQDIAVINLWTEYRYKGYNYLRKSTRKKLYAHLENITLDFDVFWQGYTSPEPDEKRRLLGAIMAYFHDTYSYRASSSFGRLLRDPNEEKLVGDCNQIVTLYIYLYSRYCDIRDLQLRLLPGHVALHYKGEDIEATNGTFADYSAKPDNTLMPIEEIVSINLLDTTDENFATHEVPPEDFLQASRFAYILSHDRDIVTKNLDTAYTIIVKQLMSRHNFTRALTFAKQSKAVDLLAVVGHNGALHNMQHNRFKTARTFARYALKSAELIQDSYRAEGAYYYNQKKFSEALKAFNEVGDQMAVKKCYEGMFFDAQNQLPKQLTSKTIINHRKAVSKMRHFAQKSGNKDLIKHVDQLRQYL